MSGSESSGSRGGGQKEKLITKVARVLLRDAVSKVRGGAAGAQTGQWGRCRRLVLPNTHARHRPAGRRLAGRSGHNRPWRRRTAGGRARWDGLHTALRSAAQATPPHTSSPRLCWVLAFSVCAEGQGGGRPALLQP